MYKIIGAVAVKDSASFLLFGLKDLELPWLQTGGDGPTRCVRGFDRRPSPFISLP